MLARSVMWCACLMACVTSSFMLCISYQWKRECVRLLLRQGGINTKTELNSSPPNTYHLKQPRTCSLLRGNWPICPWKKNPFHNTLPFSLFIFHLLVFLLHVYQESSSSQMNSSPAHTLPVFTALCKYFRHCTRHKSHFTIHPSFSVLLLNF